MKRDADPRIAAWVLAAVLAAAFALRLVLGVAALSPAQRELGADERGYHALALNLLDGQGLTYWRGSAQRVPMYPIFIAGIYQAFGRDAQAVRFAQVFLGVLTCFLIFRIGALLYGSRVGLAAAGIAAVYPPFIRYAYFGGPGFLLSENLAMPLLLGALWAMLGARRSGRAAWASGILFGLGTLTRPEIVVLPVGAALWLLGWGGLPGRAAARRGLFVLIGCALTVAPWIIRNYRIHGRMMLTSKVGEGLFSMNNDAARGGFVLWERNPNYREAEFAGLSEAERNEALAAAAFRYLAEHPRRIPELAARKTAVHWNLFHHETDSATRYNAGYAVVLGLAALGLALTAAAAPAAAALGLGLFACSTLLAIVFGGDMRLRYSLTDPVLIVLAAAGLAAVWRRWGGKAACGIAGAVLAGNGLILACWDKLYPVIQRLTP